MDSEKELIDKCLNGNPYSKERTEACAKLTDKCADIIYKTEETAGKNARNRRAVAGEIINDIKFINEESIFDEPETIASGESFNYIISRPNLFDDSFDENQYLDDKKGKFEVCHIALYGLEKQFWVQVSEGLFQTENNAEALKNIEKLIFDPNVYISPHNKRWEINDLKNLFNEIIKEFDSTGTLPILPHSIQSKIINGNARELSDYNTNEIYSFGKWAVDYEMIPYRLFYNYISDADIKQEICNDITNPKVEQGRYRICSQAGLDGKQSFNIQKKRIITRSFIKDKEEFIETLKNRIENETKIWSEMVSKFNIKHYTDEEMKKIVNEITGREKIIERNKDILRGEEEELQMYLKGQWYIVKELDCWHNFLGLVSYPETLKKKWLDIQLAYENGEISEEKATKLIKEIGELEEAFKARYEEGQAGQDFTKPTTYQPTRARLYGSQMALNDLINKTLRFYPLDGDIVPNTYIYQTIKNSFSDEEVFQLTSNMIFTDKKYFKLIEKYKNLSYDEWYALIEPIVKKMYLEDIFMENWDIIIKGILDKNPIFRYDKEMTEIARILWNINPEMTDDRWYWRFRNFFKYYLIIQPEEDYNVWTDNHIFICDERLYEWKVDDVDFEEVIMMLLPDIPRIPAIEILKMLQNIRWNFSGEVKFFIYMQVERLYSVIYAEVIRTLITHNNFIEEHIDISERELEDIHQKIGKVVKAMEFFNEMGKENNIPKNHFFSITKILKQYGFEYKWYK